MECSNHETHETCTDPSSSLLVQQDSFNSGAKFLRICFSQLYQRGYFLSREDFPKVYLCPMSCISWLSGLLWLRRSGDFVVSTVFLGFRLVSPGKNTADDFLNRHFLNVDVADRQLVQQGLADGDDPVALDLERDPAGALFDHLAEFVQVSR